MAKQSIKFNSKTILVTGAAGFIGAYLVERLLAFDSKMTIIGVDNMNDYYDPSLKVHAQKRRNACIICPVSRNNLMRNIQLKYRLDRMQELELTDEDRREVPEGYNIADFFEKEFSMMTGNISTVELLCENRLMGSIIDVQGQEL